MDSELSFTSSEYNFRVFNSVQDVEMDRGEDEYMPHQPWYQRLFFALFGGCNERKYWTFMALLCWPPLIFSLGWLFCSANHNYYNEHCYEGHGITPADNEFCALYNVNGTHVNESHQADRRFALTPSVPVPTITITVNTCAVPFETVPAPTVLVTSVIAESVTAATPDPGSSTAISTLTPTLMTEGTASSVSFMAPVTSTALVSVISSSLINTSTSSLPSVADTSSESSESTQSTTQPASTHVPSASPPHPLSSTSVANSVVSNKYGIDPLLRLVVGGSTVILTLVT